MQLPHEELAGRRPARWTAAGGWMRARAPAGEEGIERRKCQDSKWKLRKVVVNI